MKMVLNANKPKQFDVIIAGGGPAGVLCACELYALGYQVGLVDVGEVSARLEGLAPRAVQLLQHKGLESALQAVSAYQARQVSWGSLRDSSNGEHLVDRPQFDALLRRSAEQCGIIGIKQRIVRFQPDDQHVHVHLAQGEPLLARFVVDARGRRANRMEHAKRAPKNVALAAWLQVAEWPVGTQIIALEQGWLWSAKAASKRDVWVQLLVDAHTLPAQDQLAKTIEAAWQQAFGMKAQVLSKPVVRGADFRLHQTWHLAEHILPIGDAACAFDPLSGHGMFWAFSSALSAVAVVNTVLDDPSLERTALCEQFYRQRQTETFWRQARVGRDFYQASGQQHKFWQQRASWPDQQPLEFTSVSKPIIFTGPAIRANQIEATRLLQVPDEVSPVAWFGELSLVDTLEACWNWKKQGQVLDFESFERLCKPQVSQAVLIRCWQWLHRHHLLDRPIHA